MDFQEAFDATNPDPAAYGIPPDAPDGDKLLQERRTAAAQNLLAGVAANEAYWNSRSPLEELAARATGHASIGTPPDHPANAGQLGGGEAPAIETTATDTGAGGSEEDTAAKLRDQIRSLGGTPEA